jgi:putative ABC transport system permease protein
MTAAWSDLRYALRQLRKSPGFTVTAVLTLAFGIGATVAIFSMVYGILLRPLPFNNPSHLVRISDLLQGLPAGSGSGEVGVTGPEVAAYSRNTHAFSTLGAWQFRWGLGLSSGDQAAALDAPLMDAGMFPTLGVNPMMGRYFTKEEVDHDEHVVVLSYPIWKDLLHSDPGIIGRKVDLEREPYIVIGVMPRGFNFPMRSGHVENGQIWTPLHLGATELNQPGWRYSLVGRLKPGVTEAQAMAQITGVQRSLSQTLPPFMANLHSTAFVGPLAGEQLDLVRPMIRVLFLAVCVVLLIACANLAGLLLVRAIRRRKETAVRIALGSSAATLMRQALFESLALCIAGGLLGIGLAAIAVRVGVILLPDYMPRIDAVDMNWPAVAFAIFIAVATGAVAAVAPAFAAIRTNMNDALKEGGRSDGSGGGHSRLRSTLVVAEITVALILLVVSGLLLRSFQKLQNVDLGFKPDHVVTATYDLPKKKYVTQADIESFRRNLQEKLKQMPGLLSYGLTTSFPDCDCGGTPYVIDGYVPPKNAAMNIGNSAQIEGDYFGTMRIPLLRGRLFTQADNEKSQLVVIVNRELANRYWPRQDPIGKRLRLGTAQMKTPWLTVVGVVAGVKENSPELPTSEQFYQPLAQVRASYGDAVKPTDVIRGRLAVMVRSPMTTQRTKQAIAKVFHDLDPQLPLMEVHSMNREVSSEFSNRTFSTQLITAFAIAAVLLAMLGIYSVIAFSTAMRTHEMAIRMALGSSRFRIIRLVLSSGARLALIGSAIGIAGAMLISRLLHSVLFEVGPFDPLVLMAAAVAILALSVAASFLPARRAASIDPMKALRSE